MYENLLYERQGQVAILTLNRPEARNAINGALWNDIGHALDEAAADSGVSVVVVTGSGDKSFCAGADLKEIGEGGLRCSPEMRAYGFAGITRHPIQKPLIAAVNGNALGGGTEIALACDLIVAVESAQFGLPEVKRGLIANAGGLVRLPRQIPAKIAFELILTGKPISAAEALRLGLINRVAPAGQLIPVTMEFAAEVAVNAPLALAYSKEIANLTFDLPLDEAWQASAARFKLVQASADAQEGIAAFKEKRAPNWQGR
jgi:crotonobetainyl-CoA hydratase